MLKNLLAAVVTIAFLATPNIASAQEKTILQVGLGDPIDSEMGAIGTRFKEILEARSGGRVEVQLFPSGQLGDETEMIQNVRAGNLDIAVVGIANTVPFVKKLGILTMPYIFDDLYDVVRATTGPAHDLLNGYAVNEGGFRILGWTYTDYRYLSNSRKPIRNLNDIRGMKFRVPQSAVLLASYKAWGANPIPLSWAETFTALQQGVVDGQCYGYITFLACRFNEVQKYITEVHYTYQLQPMILSQRAYKKMSPELRRLVIDAGRDAQEYCLAFQLTEGVKARQRVIESGVLVSQLEDEADWKRAAVSKVWPEMEAFVGGRDAINAFLSAIGKRPWK
ncbi:TRAP transporter substrate-binding protein [uncultured Bilophila sp.]|uniref:TRAP transporter substrate-binding protein n=1 Tax=uncultured Bilophila sp. TaxID=529385 RepID=UPI0026DAFD78|nr:TRAP transporter substrate-binding protein [uncultured Bilophila sp.]